MASSKLTISVTRHGELCDKCAKLTDEKVLALTSGAHYRNDHMIQYVHASCMRVLLDSIK